MGKVSGALLVLSVCFMASIVHCCIEGELNNIPEACEEFDECTNGLMLRKRCPLGQHFNGKKCDNFWNVNCKQKECVEGMIYERGFCSVDYDVCLNGRLRRKSCPALYSFNGVYCVPKDVCKETTKCKEGDLSDLDDASYMECVNGEYITKYCQPGSIFEKEAKSCQPVAINLKDIFCHNNNRRPLPDCSMYEECIQGSYANKKCPKGMLFDVGTKMCRYSWEATCDEDSCENGLRIPIPNDCKSYYECKDGKREVKKCAWLKYFDPVFQMCTYTKSCIRNPCKGDWTKLSDDCSEYTICRNGYQLHYSCPWLQKYQNGYCSLSNKCENPNVFLFKKEECTNGQKRRIFGRCTEYEQCVNKKWKVMVCPKGTNFQGNSCEKKECPLKPVLNHCSMFTEPNSEIQLECKFGYLFDEYERQCVYVAAARCALGECIDKEIVNHPTDCSKYKVCDKGKWNIKTCSALYPHFDINSKECKFWKYSCRYDTVNCTSGDQKPDPTDCKQYEKCIDESWRTTKCWFWQHFDSVTNQCATFKYKCLSKTSEETNDKISYQMIKEKSIFFDKFMTKGIALKSDCKDGETSSIGQCRYYQECIFGQPVIKKCSPCKNYNDDEKKCDWVWRKPCKSGITDSPDLTTSKPVTPSPKPKCKNGDKVGIHTDCNKYNECKNGGWVKYKCGLWGKFDTVTKECFYFEMWKVHCA